MEVPFHLMREKNDVIEALHLHFIKLVSYRLTFYLFSAEKTKISSFVSRSTEFRQNTCSGYQSSVAESAEDLSRTNTTGNNRQNIFSESIM